MSRAPAVRRILCHAPGGNPGSREAAAALVMDLRRAGYEVAGSPGELGPHGPDFIIVLGGDGSLMESLRDFDYPPAPVFGLNFGTVGFLMNTPDCLPALVEMIRGWEFQVEQHPLLRAKLVLEEGAREELLAFNDFVIERMTRQSVRLEVFIDDVPFNRYAGDGFVLSTAAGSTAYNLAAGGPVVHPTVEAMLVTPLYPHRASPFHSIQFSVVLPLRSRLRIVAGDLPKREMRVVADGKQVERVVSVEVEDSGRRVTLLRPERHRFVARLARKFIGE